MFYGAGKKSAKKGPKTTLFLNCFSTITFVDINLDHIEIVLAMIFGDVVLTINMIKELGAIKVGWCPDNYLSISLWISVEIVPQCSKQKGILRLMLEFMPFTI